MSLEIDDILEGLRTNTDVYKREVVDAAIEKRAEIAPHLIDILKNALFNPDEYMEDVARQDHIYALMLLGHFEETAAHDTIVNQFSLPGRTAHDLYGDVGLSDLPIILVKTCGGNLGQIKSMALNRSVDDYFRVSAFHALAYAVLDGYISRRAVLKLIEDQFTIDEADKVSDYWGLIACQALDLYPEEIMETIDRAYEEGLIFPGMVGRESFEEDLALGKEACLDRLRRSYDRDSLDDLHARMSWWACFNENKVENRSVTKPPVFARPNPIVQPKKVKKVTKEQTARKKKKRKLAKKSKRKNRR